MQLIPAVDLLGEDAVRLERGDYERVLFRYPVAGFLARVVATRPPLIHLVDLDGARSGAARPALVARCVAAAGDVGLQVSGGLRRVEDALGVVAAGARRVIVGTAAWSSPEAMGAFVAALGERLVVALDVRDGQVQVRGWTASSGLGVPEALSRCREAGVARVHVTAIERDGTLGGPDLELYREVCASGLAVVAAGGVRDEDLAALEEAGCEAAVMGLGYLSRLGLDVAGSP
ncbi:MAG: 1-(5-phosphoribosyl)-5-[(5-phosphoribosylamino)methylideneamino] imidazole-4-carboxamide isomerase [Acidobacteriota bacterium]|nr:1-(5-phosphoribosyl)-5-[(5-phosphoribosylamino)methylideneamino] imidazole-4-carboxamide isomerase [Acidobacteriota bacterium]